MNYSTILLILGISIGIVCSYQTPIPQEGDVLFYEPFDSESNFKSRWVFSGNSKYNGNDQESLELSAVSSYEGAENKDKALNLKEPARFYGISSPLTKPWDPKDGKPITIQYEVRLGKNHECGGAYLKLLSLNKTNPIDPKSMTDQTPFTIMFGPDHCGSDTNKVHFIVRHQSPVTGFYEEKHLVSPPRMKEDVAVSHLYTLTLNPDGDFEISIDSKSEKTGNILDDFAPPINPPKEIDDPEDKKPIDWVDAEEIPDPTASKPDDWDENAPELIPDPEAKKPEDWDENAPEFIPDPEAKKPADWDDDMDGDFSPPEIPNPVCQEHGCGKWEPASIQNPNYKGKWSAPMIKNPAYKGPFKPRKIPNPNYFYDAKPIQNIAPIERVAIEIWSVTPLVSFDNIVITTDKKIAGQIAGQSWTKKFEAEEAERKKQEEAQEKARKAEEEELQGNGWREKVQQISEILNDYVVIALSFAEKNPVVAIAVLTSVVGLIPIILWCVCSGKQKQTIQVPIPVKKEDEKEKEKQTPTEEKKQENPSVSTSPSKSKKRAQRDDQ